MKEEHAEGSNGVRLPGRRKTRVDRGDGGYRGAGLYLTAGRAVITGCTFAAAEEGSHAMLRDCRPFGGTLNRSSAAAEGNNNKILSFTFFFFCSYTTTIPGRTPEPEAKRLIRHITAYTCCVYRCTACVPISRLRVLVAKRTISTRNDKRRSKLCAAILFGVFLARSIIRELKTLKSFGEE